MRFDLLFTMEAWRQMERRLWPLADTEARLKACVTKPEGILQLCELLAILTNAAAEADGRPERKAAEDIIGDLTVDTIPDAVKAAAVAIVDGMRVRSLAKQKPQPVDVTLEELNRRDRKNRDEWARIAGYGLIAGVPIADQRTCQPGMLVDWYLQRQKYDDEQHQLRRKRKG